MTNELFLEVNGVRFRGFTNASVSKSMENLSGQFSFSASSRELILNDTRILENQIKVQDEVRVLIDEEPIITGTVEDLNISYDAGSHSISVSGRDKTGDIIDSSTIQKQYNQRNFKRLIELVLADNGYSNISVINEVPNIDNLSENEKVKTESGDTVFSFIDRYAQKLQVLLVTDSEGNIVITREGSGGAGGALLSTKNNPDNNILSASINVNSSDRFRFIEVYSQSDNSTFAINTVNQNAISEDTEVRAPRRKRVTSRVASNQSFLDNLAKWHVNMRRAKGQRYNCRVVGYYTGRDNGLLWLPNTLVQVRDDKCQLDGQFLIQGITYTKSNQGSFTDLSIVNTGSFSLDTQSAITQLTTNDFASNLFKSA